MSQNGCALKTAYTAQLHEPKQLPDLQPKYSTDSLYVKMTQRSFGTQNHRQTLRTHGHAMTEVVSSSQPELVEETTSHYSQVSFKKVSSSSHQVVNATAAYTDEESVKNEMFTSDQNIKQSQSEQQLQTIAQQFSKSSFPVSVASSRKTSRQNSSKVVKFTEPKERSSSQQSKKSEATSFRSFSAQSTNSIPQNVVTTAMVSPSQHVQSQRQSFGRVYEDDDELQQTPLFTGKEPILSNRSDASMDMAKQLMRDIQIESEDLKHMITVQTMSTRIKSLHEQIDQKDQLVAEMAQQMQLLKDQYQQLKAGYSEQNVTDESKLKKQLASKVVIESQKIEIEDLKKQCSKYQLTVDDLVTENTKLVIGIARLQQVELEKLFLEQQLQKMHAQTEQLTQKQTQLEHEVKLQFTLRDQFKTFVKDNMEAFDFDRFVDLNTTANQTMTSKHSPKPNKREFNSTYASEQRQKALMESNLAKKRQYAEMIRQVHKSRSRSRTPTGVDNEEGIVDKFTRANAMDLRRVRKHSKQRNPQLPDVQQIMIKLHK